MLIETQQQNSEYEELIETLEAEFRRRTATHNSDPLHGDRTSSMMAMYYNSKLAHSNNISDITQTRTRATSDALYLRKSEARKSLLRLNEEMTNGAPNSYTIDNILIQQNKLEENGQYSIFYKLRKLYTQMLPFQTEILMIESQFGSSVMSYFAFCRFVYVQFFFLGCISIVFSYFHIVRMIRDGDGGAIIVSNSILPGLMQFSSFTTQENVLYTTMIICYLTILSASIIRKSISEDRRMKFLSLSESHQRAEFATEALCSWDFSITNEQEGRRHSGRLAQSLLVALEDSRTKGVQLSRSRKQIMWLYARRICTNILYLCLQTAAFAAIISVTVYETNIKTNVGQLSHYDGAGLNYLSLIIYNMITLMMPEVLYYITAYEVRMHCICIC